MKNSKPDDDFSDRVLLTIHGVNSDNRGLSRLRSECEKQLPGLISDSYYYEYVVPFSDLTKATCELIFRSVHEKIELTWLRHINGNGKRLFIVAHSFGTLAVIRALQMHIPNVQIDGLILLGSIVPSGQHWDGMIRNKLLKSAPLAIIRPFDLTVRMSGKVGGEPSGAKGFIANGQYRVREVYKSGGHTAYYPDDVSDVEAVIRSGIESIPEVSCQQWKKKCHFMDRMGGLFWRPAGAILEYI